MIHSLSGPRKASYVLLFLALAVAARFHLGHALIAALFSFMLLDEAHKTLRGVGASPRVARWSALALFLVIGALLATIFASFISIAASRLPEFLDHFLPRLNALADRFGVDLPVDNVQELRTLILNTFKSHAESVTSTSGFLTRGFFQITIAVLVAILRFLTDPPEEPQNRALDAELLRECGDRVALFSASFERVMSAQILIAAINAGLAAVFLFAFHIPFRTMLTLTTFVCGIVPIVGNLLSNAMIVAAALTRSEHAAVAALVFLVLVHKGGYLLNSRIVGARIQTSTWAILLGLLVGEALWGVTGVILAPTLIFYVREELRAIPAASR